MTALRIWVIVTWISLPTVMYGGYALFRYVNRDNAMTAHQISWFRAGYAHAGVLLVMRWSTICSSARRRYRFAMKNAACAVLAAGIIAQSGGFFIHMIVGKPNQPSIGTTDDWRGTADMRHPGAGVWFDRDTLVVTG